MTIEEFLQREAEWRRTKPSLFRLATPDPPATDTEIAVAEGLIGCKLPSAYRQFLQAAGGGDYLLFTVFSVSRDSAWYLPRQVMQARPNVPDNLLPVHDDQAGGYYVLQIVDGRAEDPVFYFDWETGTLSEKKYESVLDAVADNAIAD